MLLSDDSRSSDNYLKRIYLSDDEKAFDFLYFCKAGFPNML
jgi:hypothetical protein